MIKHLLLTVMLCSLVAATACGGDDDSPTAPSPGGLSELQITDVVVGTGTEATRGRTVSVHYTGWLYDPNAADRHGRRFESSRDLGVPLTPFQLGAGRVIPGWDQGLVGMKVGGQRTLAIPSRLAYGPSGNGTIPPNADLIFDVELLGVN